MPTHRAWRCVAGSQQETPVDCGPLAVLFLMAACVVGLLPDAVGGWDPQTVTVAGKFLRCQIAQDVFGLSAEDALALVDFCALRQSRASLTLLPNAALLWQASPGVRAAWSAGSPLVASLLTQQSGS